jgi:arylsulfatase
VEILSQHGYHTSAVVANGVLGREYGFARGFDEYVEPWKLWPDEAPELSVRADRVTTLAVEMLARLPSDRPFFMWVHYIDPHRTYAPPEPFRTRFDAMVSPHDDLESVTCEPTVIPSRGYVSPGGRCTLPGIVARYDAEIAYVDQEIGRLLAAFESSGLSERAIMVFSSDHGEALGEGEGYFGHGRTVRQREVRVPLSIRIPGAPSMGSTVDHPVDLVDLSPTLLGLLDLPRGRLMQGDDLSSLVRGDEDAPVPKHAFTEAGHARSLMGAVLTRRWKLILVPDRVERRLMAGTLLELYDLEADPTERLNLAEERQDVVAELLPLLHGWQRSDLGFSATAVDEEEALPDKETLEQIEALGYLY